ncbi:MAG: posphoenolpyruvate synthetase regulatory kinase/phosphorylase PpsR [Saezia sp.]
MSNRTAFFISDGTGITVETFAAAMLMHFETPFHQIRIPFVNTVDKTHQAAKQINQAYEKDQSRPIVFSTLATPALSQILQENTNALHLDLLQMIVGPLEKELGLKSNQSVGRFTDTARSKSYNERIEAINYSLEHDDGQTNANLAQADVILVGVSRSGKTPTSLYLAMQYGIKAANYPLIPEDFKRHSLPEGLKAHRNKLFGLTIDPIRLAEIRHERHANSRYADLNNCRQEVADAESLMRREGIRWLSTTTKSIEEIATTILQEIKPERLGSIKA